LTLDEKLDITRQMLVEHHKLEEVAKQHRVSAARVAMLVSKVKRWPGMLQALQQRNLERKLVQAAINRLLDRLIAQDTFVDSAAQVVEAFEKDTGILMKTS
jgi:hypothetical protein